MEEAGRVFLRSPGIFGKTSFLANLMHKLRDRKLPVDFADLNVCVNAGSFATSLVQRLTGALEIELDKLFGIFMARKRLRRELSDGPDGGVSVGFETTVESRDAVEALLKGLSQAEAIAIGKRTKALVIIDEFSDIEIYNEGSGKDPAVRDPKT